MTDVHQGCPGCTGGAAETVVEETHKAEAVRAMLHREAGTGCGDMEQRFSRDQSTGGSSVGLSPAI